MKETNGNISHKDGLLTFLAPLLKVALPLLQNMLTLLAKTVLVSLKLTAGASATDRVIQKNIFGPQTKRIFSNEEMDDITEIVRYLEESSFPIKGIHETIKNKAKEKR